MESTVTKITDRGTKENSARKYIRDLYYINNNSPFNNLTFLKNPQIVLDHIEQYRVTTQKNYLASVLSVLGTVENSKVYKPIIKRYNEILKEIESELETTNPKNVKTSSMKKNWIDWSQVIEKRDALMAKVDTFKNKKSALDERKEYNRLIDLTVLSLYTYLPPRRNEFSEMSVVKNRKQIDREDWNYLILDEKKFLINRFKTAGTHGSTEIDIPNELMNVLNIYLKHHPLLIGQKRAKYPVRFLVIGSGKAIPLNNGITRILNRVFDRKIGSSMLRHIYLTSKYGDESNEREQDASAMGHSTSTQAEYIMNKPDTD